MSRSIFIYAFLITLFIAGCSYATPMPLKTDLPSLVSEWTIKLTHSGGIMGLSRSIEISFDGKYVVMDERAGKTITGKLSTDELIKLNKLIANYKYIMTNNPRQSNCADCFIYNLEIQGNGKKFSVQEDDITLPKSGMETLIIYLRGLIDAALK
jgi:hypothetical protein